MADFLHTNLFNLVSESKASTFIVCKQTSIKMAVRLSEQDKKELDRYNRNFVMKTLQVIVQSRCGEKSKYTAKENSGLEWFSLPIPDLQELTAVARKTLGSGPLLTNPINVEISLKKKESNNYIFLEVWSVSLDTESKDPDVKISSGVYSRMSQALKSVLVVTRAAHGSRVAQRQREDDYQLHYQFYVGNPNIELLGEEVKTVHVAAATTPSGTIRVKLAFTNSPHVPAKTIKKQSQLVDIKDDHFSHPNSIHISEPKPCNRKFRNPKSVEDLRYLESLEKQDACTTNFFSTSPPEGFSPPLPRISEIITSTQDSLDGQKNRTQNFEDPFSKYQSSALFTHIVGTVVQLERPEDRPFAVLLDGLPLASADTSSETLSECSDTEDKDGDKETAEEEEDFNDASEHLDIGIRSESPVSNDFVMLPPLDLPFANSTPMTDLGQLGQFYREMQMAANKPIGQLTTPVNQAYLEDLMGQIEKYDKEQPRHLQFLKSISKEEEELSDS